MLTVQISVEFVLILALLAALIVWSDRAGEPNSQNPDVPFDFGNHNIQTGDRNARYPGGTGQEHRSQDGAWRDQARLQDPFLWELFQQRWMAEHARGQPYLPRYYQDPHYATDDFSRGIANDFKGPCYAAPHHRPSQRMFHNEGLKQQYGPSVPDPAFYSEVVVDVGKEVESGHLNTLESEGEEELISEAGQNDTLGPEECVSATVDSPDEEKQSTLRGPRSVWGMRSKGRWGGGRL